MQDKANRSLIFIILRLARVLVKFLSKIVALLDTHLLFSWDAGTKQLIGCKWVLGTVDSLVILHPYNFQSKFLKENFFRYFRCQSLTARATKWIYTGKSFIYNIFQLVKSQISRMSHVAFIFLNIGGIHKNKLVILYYVQKRYKQFFI